MRMYCHEDFMKIAVEEAKTGVDANHGGPFGAIVVKDNEIIATGHNMVLVNNDPTCHAEVTAIRNACKVMNNFSLKGCTLYTSCYPCPMCLGAILWSGIEICYFAANSDEAASVGFDDAEFHSFLQGKQSNVNTKLSELKVEDYMKPFNMWNQKVDKIPY
uniref:CMP/dCMP-type deaminase domain-containing protein n=1 Tax=Parastrongyloides trichosuri TaxID=131310 RepID=A0A0N4Z1Z1_PARTI